MSAVSSLSLAVTAAVFCVSFCSGITEQVITVEFPFCELKEFITLRMAHQDASQSTDEEPLKNIFDQAMKLYDNIEKGNEATNSDPVQVPIFVFYLDIVVFAMFLIYKCCTFSNKELYIGNTNQMCTIFAQN